MNALLIPFSLVLIFSLNCALAGDDVIKKKGICLGGGAESQKQIESLNVGWHYNWTPTWKGRKIKNTPFVPMLWANSKWAAESLKDLRVAKSQAGANPLLGLNEPDGKDQANMSVEAALAFWPQLEKTNRRLGSPATVHPDNEWMKSFIKGAGEKGYRVDFICVHWYGPNDPVKFIERMEAVHKLYGKPIWITEFAIADWSANKSKDIGHRPEEVLQFMKAVLPKLESLGFVERYAWFHAPPDHPKLGSSALFNKNGELTKLGEFYASFGR